MGEGFILPLFQQIHLASQEAWKRPPKETATWVIWSEVVTSKTIKPCPFPLLHHSLTTTVPKVDCMWIRPNCGQEEIAYSLVKEECILGWESAGSYKYFPAPKCLAPALLVFLPSVGSCHWTRKEPGPSFLLATEGASPSNYNKGKISSAKFKA